MRVFAIWHHTSFTTFTRSGIISNAKYRSIFTFRMRTFAVSVLFLVALINGIDGRPDGSGNPQICEPGSVTKVECNTCRCSIDGTALACTKMECPKIPSEFLNPDGSLKLPHQSNPLLRLGRRSVYRRSADSETKQICEPGTKTKVDCNTCTCSSDGTALACTKMQCPKIPSEFFNPDGSLKLPHQSNPLLRTKRSDRFVRSEAAFSCQPNTSWKEDCNTCTCTANGRNAFCTLMACLPRNTFPVQQIPGPGSP